MFIGRLAMILSGIGMLVAVTGYLAKGEYMTAAMWSAFWVTLFTAWLLVPKADRGRHRRRFEIREPVDSL